MAAFQVRDFKGGISDAYLASEPNRFAKLHNFQINDKGKLFTIDGLSAASVRAPVSSGSTKFSGLYLGPTPFLRPVVSRKDLMYNQAVDGTWTAIVGPQGNVPIPNKTTDTFESAIMWQGQLLYAAGSTVLPHRIYCSTNSPTTFVALTLGLPALASDPGIFSSGGTGGNYQYAFHYVYRFTDYNGTEYEEKGPVTYVTTGAQNIGAPNVNSVSINPIPAIANTTTTNYDILNVDIAIFRTQSNGTVFYKLTEQDADGTAYIDTTSDTVLQDAEVLYTDGDVLEYEPPASGLKYVTQVNDIFFYADDIRLQQSIQGAPGACPPELEYFTEQKIKGLSSILSYPILFCDKSIYRIEGFFDEFGDGGFELKQIHTTAGCASHRSIVSIPGGLVWAGNGGFYFTDGSSAKHISMSLPDSYRAWKSSIMNGVYDSRNNTVVWTVATSPGSTSPSDVQVVLHLDFGISDDCTFTTQGSIGNIYPTVLAFSESEDIDEDTYRNRLVMMDSRGYLLYSDPLRLTVPRIEETVAPDDFKEKILMVRMESAGLDFGQDATRKYCTHITAELKTETECHVQFLSRRDDGGPWQSMSEMRYDGAITWGISEYPWDGVDDGVDHSWNALPVLEGMRHLPAGTLRSTRRQIALTNALSWITNSDTLGTASNNTTTKRVTLNTAASDWPGDCEDYEILFASDSYTASYVVKNRISDTVVEVYDPYGTLPAGTTLAWQMRGYRKFERVNLLSYSIFFEDEGPTQPPSRGESEFVNA